eukprot:846210-Amphidinium_carterae.1
MRSVECGPFYGIMQSLTQLLVQPFVPNSLLVQVYSLQAYGSCCNGKSRCKLLQQPTTGQQLWNNQAHAHTQKGQQQMPSNYGNLAKLRASVESRRRELQHQGKAARHSSALHPVDRDAKTCQE